LTKLILASASPRREELLRRMGLPFTVCPSQIDENDFKDMPALERVEALALAKARDVAATHQDALVIGADTIVVCRGNIMGKPATTAKAVSMLAYLSGRVHTVYTGIAVVQAPAGPAYSACVDTDVAFRKLAAPDIAAYVATGEPMDKAGAYGIQGLGGLLVTAIKGDYYNVVGLPLGKLQDLLAKFDYNVWDYIGKEWPGLAAPGGCEAKSLHEEEVE